MKTIICIILAFAFRLSAAQAVDHTAEISNLRAQCTSVMDTGLCATALDSANYTDPRGYLIQGTTNRWVPNSMVLGLSNLRFSKDPDGSWSMCNLISAYCNVDWDGDGCVLVRSRWRSSTISVATSRAYTACLVSAGARKVTDFGSFVPNLTDAATRAANTATINSAIDTVGIAGGVICLPPGIFYLTNRVGGQEAIAIKRSNTTLRGSGMVAATGGTRLVTRSDWNLDSSGAVYRGFGLRIFGSPFGSTKVAPLTNIVLRDFELDGGAGWTGQFNFPADTSTGDGWDITHKGIILAFDDCVNTVSMSRVWVHSYRGEVIYAGGQCLQTVTVDGIKAEDTNASTFNITANLTVTNSYFGKSSLWMEIGAAGPYNSSTWTNNTFADASRYGINIAQGDGRANTPHTFKNNTLSRCGNTGFYLGGGSGGPITIQNNTFTACSGLTTGKANNAASWADYNNKLVTFSGNMLTNVGTLAYLGELLIDSTISNNVVVNTTGVVGNTTASFLCGSKFTNVSIAGNTYTSARTPEQTCALVSGTRPLFSGNIYTGGELRNGQGTTHITSTNAKITPQFEQATIITDVANVIAVMDVAQYPDGQVVILTGGSSSNPLRFPTGQTTYTVAAERTLTGGSLQFTFSASQAKWVESN